VRPQLPLLLLLLLLLPLPMPTPSLACIYCDADVPLPRFYRIRHDMRCYATVRLRRSLSLCSHHVFAAGWRWTVWRTLAIHLARCLPMARRARP
jgi:hypothetical protein